MLEVSSSVHIVTTFFHALWVDTFSNLKAMIHKTHDLQKKNDHNNIHPFSNIACSILSLLVGSVARSSFITILALWQKVSQRDKEQVLAVQGLQTRMYNAVHTLQGNTQYVAGITTETELMLLEIERKHKSRVFRRVRIISLKLYCVFFSVNTGKLHVQTRVPDPFIFGSSADLYCTYSWDKADTIGTDGAPLDRKIYSLKWYKGHEEFFR